MSQLAACPSCEAPVHQDWRFCVECGAERPGLYEPDRPGVAVADLDPTGDDAPQPEDELPGGRRVVWRTLDAAAVFLLSLLATTVVAGIVLVAIGEDPTTLESDLGLAVGILANQLALGGGTLWWLRARHRVGVLALGFGRPDGRAVRVGVAAGLVGVLASASVALFVTWLVTLVQGEAPPDPEQIPLESADPSLGLLVLLGISTILLAPLAEEIFFRGMLHQGMRRRLAFVPGAIASSVLFAASHVIPIVIPSIFVLSIVLTVVYERTRSLWTPIVAHATFNVVGFWASFLAT